MMRGQKEHRHGRHLRHHHRHGNAPRAKRGQSCAAISGRSNICRSAARGQPDFVSRADQQSERTLYDELLKARPDWGFLLEEGGDIPGAPGKPRWVIDPLDGTSNFLHGIPHFAISIAVQEAAR